MGGNENTAFITKCVLRLQHFDYLYMEFQNRVQVRVTLLPSPASSGDRLARPGWVQKSFTFGSWVQLSVEVGAGGCGCSGRGSYCGVGFGGCWLCEEHAANPRENESFATNEPLRLHFKKTWNISCINSARCLYWLLWQRPIQTSAQWNMLIMSDLEARRINTRTIQDTEEGGK